MSPSNWFCHFLPTFPLQDGTLTNRAHLLHRHPLFLLEVQDFMYLNLTNTIFKLFNFLFICVCTHAHTHACTSTICVHAHGSQKKTSDPLKLKLQVIVCEVPRVRVLRTELGSSG